MLPDGWDSPEGRELGNSNATLSEWDKFRGLSSQRLDPGELCGSETLHVDAVSEESVPSQILISIWNEDPWAIEDLLSVLLPGEIQFGTARRDFGWEAWLRSHVHTKATRAPEA